VLKFSPDMETSLTRHTKLSCFCVHDLMPAVPLIVYRRVTELHAEHYYQPDVREYC